LSANALTLNDSFMNSMTDQKFLVGRTRVPGTPGSWRTQYELKMRNANIPALTPGGEGDPAARFRAGDREAFTLIYQTHSPAVFRFVLHMCGDGMKAGEITQDVFVWLIHHPGHFDASRGTLGAFLIGVARRLLLRRWQNERRWIPFEEAGVEFGGRARTGFVPLGAAEAHVESRVARLREVIAALPARYREVVVLCDLEGHTYEDAAGVLECAVGTVRSRLHRARELLGRKLQSKKEIQGCAV
jgi:RNA polymerase sigma-70 factor (ECF subfamily)